MKVPAHLLDLVSKAFDVVDDRALASELADLAVRVYYLAYDKTLHKRTPEDNRPEHEVIVLRNTIRICCRSGAERSSGLPFDAQELRVAVATTILHDLRFIPRVTEDDVEAERKKGNLTKADELENLRREQRPFHMRGSAEDALAIIRSAPGLLTDAECRQCIGYIGLHDIWKLGWPYPASSDWLAVCCVEGDALWPLDPDYGPLADLERKNNFNPSRDDLAEQARRNLSTQLRKNRGNFSATAERFQDNETIIRTSEGARILQESRGFWGI